MIEELKEAIQAKDEKHKKEIEVSLSKINEQEKIINDLLKTRNQLIELNESMDDRMKNISDYYQTFNLSEKIDKLHSIDIYISHQGLLNISTKDVGTLKLIEGGYGKNDNDSRNVSIEGSFVGEYEKRQI
jgi:hypothetical protein